MPATPSDTPTPTITPTPLIYTVKKGDTLLAVARQFGLSVSDVQSANGIEDPRRLHIGQELIIPVKEEGTESTALPTPTPVALRMQGLAFYRTPTGSLWCLGEVYNLSAQPAEEVQVEVSLHDEQGQLLGTAAAFTQLDVVAGGGRAPFVLQFPAPPDRFAQYQARVLSGVPSRHQGPRYPHLRVVEDAGGWLDKNSYQVKGRVWNAGTSAAEDVVVIVTLYDEERHVVGARTAAIPAELFLSGANAPFDVLLTPLGAVAGYDVQVQGWWAGYTLPGETPTPVATGTPK
jgi:LysM repeat protein